MKKKIVQLLLLSILGLSEAVAVIKQMNRTIVRKEKNNSERLNINFQVLNSWVRVKQEGYSLESYLIERGIKKIAIYGMAEIGHLLYRELKNTGVQTAYAIDKNNKAVRADEITVISPEDAFEPADAIIVTVIYYFAEVKKELKEKTDIPILSLEDILNEMLITA